MIKVNKKFKILYIMLLLLIVAFAPMINPTVEAADTNYYISNSGNDSNSGTSPSQAWKTISKLNSELNGGVITDGDNIYFRRGDTFDVTSQIIMRTATGTSTNPMVWGAYGTGADPIIRTNSAISGGILYFNNANEGYVTWQNLHFLTTNTGVGKVIDTEPNKRIYNLTVHNCTWESSSATGYARMLFRNTINVTVDNCTGKNASIAIYGMGASHTIIKNCEIYARRNNGPDLITIHDNDNKDIAGNGPYHYLYNVTAHGTPTNCFDIVAAQHNATGVKGEWIYLKNCTGYNSGQPPIIVGHKSRNVTIENCYFRVHSGDHNALYLTDNRNLIVRNSVIVSEKDVIAGDPGPQYYWGWSQVNNTFYNNVIITGFDGGAGDPFITMGGDAAIEPRNGTYGLRFKNNIFLSLLENAPNTFVRYIAGGGTWNLSETLSEYSHNMWWRGDGNFNANRFVLEDGSYNINTWNALPEVTGDIATDPKMNNPSSTNFPNDFKLKETSPCIDAGDWLTYTVGGGTGTTITVGDSNYFFPGFTVRDTVITGDNIFVGDDTNLIVTAVQYEANTITVNRSITWSDGEPVSLSAYNGAAPDIGAFEFIPGLDTTPPVITNILLIGSNPLDTDPTYGWVNISCTVTDNVAVSQVILQIHNPNDSWNNVTMIARDSGQYYYRSTTSFSTVGHYSYTIKAVDTSNNVITSSNMLFSMPPNWDIDMNGACNLLDFILISNQYNETGLLGWIREDIDNNGAVNILDFLYISQHYAETW